MLGPRSQALVVIAGGWAPHVTAAIFRPSGYIVVLNPDLVLCTLDDKGPRSDGFPGQYGKGYVPTERNRPEYAPIGLIPGESLYSPGAGLLQGREHPRWPKSSTMTSQLTIETNAAVTPTTRSPMRARIPQ